MGLWDCWRRFGSSAFSCFHPTCSAQAYMLLCLGLFAVPLFTWPRSPQRAADDSFLLVRGVVTRRGLMATRWALDLRLDWLDRWCVLER